MADDALTLAPQADLIVTDTLLPGSLDGVAFVSRLKSAARTKAIPIIMLTSCAWPSERDRAYAAGCDVFLAKPCVPDLFVSEIRRLLARQHRAAPPTRAS
jgi:CheY-like chemotaxis protein